MPISLIDKLASIFVEPQLPDEMRFGAPAPTPTPTPLPSPQEQSLGWNLPVGVQEGMPFSSARTMSPLQGIGAEDIIGFPANAFTALKKGAKDFVRDYPEAQPAFKYAMLPHLPPEERLEAAETWDWADLIREAGGREESTSLFRNFIDEVGGDVLESGTKPSTFATWYAAQKALPLLGKGIEKVAPKAFDELVRPRSFKHPFKYNRELMRIPVGKLSPTEAFKRGHVSEDFAANRTPAELETINKFAAKFAETRGSVDLPSKAELIKLAKQHLSPDAIPKNIESASVPALMNLLEEKLAAPMLDILQGKIPSKLGATTQPEGVRGDVKNEVIEKGGAILRRSGKKVKVKIDGEIRQAIEYIDIHDGSRRLIPLEDEQGFIESSIKPGDLNDVDFKLKGEDERGTIAWGKAYGQGKRIAFILDKSGQWLYGKSAYSRTTREHIVRMIGEENVKSMEGDSRIPTTQPPTEGVRGEGEYIKVYRASDKPFSKELATDDGVFVGQDKFTADGYIRGYGGKPRIVEELYLDKDAKILRFKDTPKELYIKDKDGYYIPRDHGDGIEIGKYAKEHGYDAVEYWTPSTKDGFGATLKADINVVNPNKLHSTPRTTISPETTEGVRGFLKPSQRPTIYLGDIEGMAEGSTKIKIEKLPDGRSLELRKDDAGSVYALMDGKEVGYASIMDKKNFDISVAKEVQRKGIGTALTKEFLLLNPQYRSGEGEFTEAGYKTFLKAQPRTTTTTTGEGVPPAPPKPPTAFKQPPAPKTVSVFEPQPLKPSKVKQQIRDVSGQIKPSEPVISEREALKVALKRERAVGKKAFGVGKKAGAEKTKQYYEREAPWYRRPKRTLTPQERTTLKAIVKQYNNMDRDHLLNSIDRLVSKLPGGKHRFNNLLNRYFRGSKKWQAFPDKELKKLALKLEMRTSEVMPQPIREKQEDLDMFWAKVADEKTKHTTPNVLFTPFDTYSQRISPAATEAFYDPIHESLRKVAVLNADMTAENHAIEKTLYKDLNVKGRANKKTLRTRLYNATEEYISPDDIPKGLNPLEVEVIQAHNRDAATFIESVNAVRAVVGEMPIEPKKGYIRRTLLSDARAQMQEDGVLPAELEKNLKNIPPTSLYHGPAQHRLSKVDDSIFEKDFFRSWRYMIAETNRYNELRMTLERVKPYMKIMKEHPDFNPKAYKMYDKWLKQNVKHRPSGFDDLMNGMFNNVVGTYNQITPEMFNIKIGTQPYRDVVNLTQQMVHVGALGARPRMVIRNRFQGMHDWVMLGTEAYTHGRAMWHTEKGRAILNHSDEFKGRSFIVGQEAGTIGKVQNVGSSGFRWADRKNVGQSMLTSYWRQVNKYGLEENTLIPGTDIKYSPEALKKAEKYFMDTQWSYYREAMPRAFWSTTGRAVWGLTSWPMNYYNRYIPAIAKRTFYGVDPRGNPVSGTERLAGLRWLLWVGTLFGIKEYTRRNWKVGIDYLSSAFPGPSFLTGGYGPTIQFAMALQGVASAKTPYEKALAWNKMISAGLVHIPDYYGAKDLFDLATGKKSIPEYLFYTTKGEKPSKKKGTSRSMFKSVRPKSKSKKKRSMFKSVR